MGETGINLCLKGWSWVGIEFFGMKFGWNWDWVEFKGLTWDASDFYDAIWVKLKWNLTSRGGIKVKLVFWDEIGVKLS